MYDRLKILYRLQLLDDQLDELEELRGDLPHAVESLETKINDIKDSVSQKENQKKRYQILNDGMPVYRQIHPVEFRQSKPTDSFD